MWLIIRFPMYIKVIVVGEICRWFVVDFRFSFKRGIREHDLKNNRKTLLLKFNNFVYQIFITEF